MRPLTDRMHHRSHHRARHLGIGCLAVVALLSACGAGDGGTSGGADAAAGGDVASLDDDTSGEGAATDGTGAPDTTAEEVDPEAAMVAYTECMREEGVDLPDPQTNGDGNGMVIVGPGPGGSGPEGAMPQIDEEEFEAAQQTCGPILADAVGEIDIDPEVMAEQREQMLAYAECMREQGIDMPDPDFSDDGGVSIAIGAQPGEAGGPVLDPSSDEWQAAAEACGDVFGEGAPFQVSTNAVGD